jgi:hypothetical protein
MALKIPIAGAHEQKHAEISGREYVATCGCTLLFVQGLGVPFQKLRTWYFHNKLTSYTCTYRRAFQTDFSDTSLTQPLDLGLARGMVQRLELRLHRIGNPTVPGRSSHVRNTCSSRAFGKEVAWLGTGKEQTEQGGRLRHRNCPRPHHHGFAGRKMAQSPGICGAAGSPPGTGSPEYCRVELEFRLVLVGERIE